MVLITMIFFYVVGVDYFPDYENYLRIASNGGFVVSENDYIFEGVSRFILRLPYISAENRVLTLASLNQFFCVIFFLWFGFSKDQNKVFGAVLLFCAFGFFFMTTNLRASVAYCCIAWFFVRGLRFDLFGLFLLLFSFSWHDSALLLIPVLIGAKSLNWLASSGMFSEGKISKVIIMLMVVSILIIVFGEELRSSSLALLGFDFGARAAYFSEYGGEGPAKFIFLIVVVLSCFCFAFDREQTLLLKASISLMAVLVSLLSLISLVMAVRFSFFPLFIILLLRGVVFFEIERNLIFRYVSICMLSWIVFYFSIAYIESV
jgi:hypothetical protein